MPEVVADRSSYSRSKRHEISLISTSRKRKLRELYAVHSTYSAEQPIPFVAVETLDDHPTTPAEEQFLLDHDISQKHKSLEEAIPATRRQLRSDSTKTPSKGLGSLDGRRSVTPRISTKGPREDGARKSRGASPSKEFSAGSANGFLTTPDISNHGQATSRPDGTFAKTRRGSSRASSRGSQTELPASSAELLDTIVDESIADAAREELPNQETPLPPSSLEEERIEERLESRPGSPGVDPRIAIPASAEDLANLPGPIINGLQDDNHKAATVHLPSKEVQEKRLQDAEDRRAEKAQGRKKADQGSNLSIRLPPSHGSRTFPDPMSSPGSTVDALSATTPAQHEASTDTSPENEGPRYHLDKSDEKDEIPETPPESGSGKDEVLEKQEQEKEEEALQSQVDAAGVDGPGSSPAAADAQLRLEEEQAAAASTKPDQEAMDVDEVHGKAGNDLVVADSQESRQDQGSLTQGTGELVQDIVEDEDEVVGVPTPDEIKTPGANVAARPPAQDDDISTSIQDRSGEAMDIDTEPTAHLPADSSNTVGDVIKTESCQEASGPPESGSITKKDASVPGTSTSTPRRTPSAPAPTPPTQERMTTRVASGAMRHKSVSEILGEIPRPNTSTSDRTAVGKGPTDPDSAPDSTSQSRSSTPQSPGSRMRAMLAKEKERSKLSTVVFAKQANDRTANTALVPSKQSLLESEQHQDYYTPLIEASAAHNHRYPQPLDALLQRAHKTLTTSNMFVPVYERQTLNILRRINRLQHEDKWSLRQPKRCPEPNRPTTHWDELLKEVKWMRTDFREERKWKMAVAKNLAYDCADWVQADAVDRKELQVNASIPPVWSGQATDTLMQDAATSSAVAVSHSTPDLVPSDESDPLTDEFDDEPRTSLLQNVAPATMFTLSDDDVVFGLRRSPVTDNLLKELPMYGIPLKVPRSGLPTSDIDPDASWRRPAIPFSKYMEGKIVLLDEGPPRKKSRYEYEEEEDDDDQFVYGEDGPKRSSLPPILTEVALFNPENKHIRDRIHAGHQFRPPSENPMPLQSFFESRLASQWTWPEDDELKNLVREYSYNWQLISCLLTSPSMYSSGAERRTPWECFERWIHLEGLPADMQKTHYFRAYNNRLEAAQRNLMSMAAAAPPVNVGGAMVPARRRTTTSIRVERRRNQKHLTLVDAMRKLAKKRETTEQKQKASAGLIAQRKTADQSQPQNAKHTPQDFSRLKHERDLALQERMARLQMQQEAQRRALLQARNPQANPQQYGPSNNGGSQQPRNPAAPNGMPVANMPPNGNRPNQLAVPGQNMPRPQMQPMPNGMGGQMPMPNPGNLSQMPMNGLPQGQMNGMPGIPNMPNMPNMQTRPSVPNAGPDMIMMQAHRMAEQQRQAVQMRQQSQQPPGQPQVHNSPPNMRANMTGNMNPNMNGMSQQAYLQNQAMMAGFNMNGVSTPPSNGFNVQNPGQAGSPRMGQPSQPQQMLNGSGPSPVAQLEKQFRAAHPQAPPEQITKMVRDHLQQSMHRQQAMQAAAGNGTPLQGMPGQAIPGGVQNPQQYARMLTDQMRRQQAEQQQQQQNRSASAGSGSGNAEAAK